MAFPFCPLRQSFKFKQNRISIFGSCISKYYSETSIFYTNSWTYSANWISNFIYTYSHAYIFIWEGTEQNRKLLSVNWRRTIKSWSKLDVFVFIFKYLIEIAVSQFSHCLTRYDTSNFKIIFFLFRILLSI